MMSEFDEAGQREGRSGLSGPPVVAHPDGGQIDGRTKQGNLSLG